MAQDISTGRSYVDPSDRKWIQVGMRIGDLKNLRSFLGSVAKGMAGDDHEKAKALAHELHSFLRRIHLS